MHRHVQHSARARMHISATREHDYYARSAHTYMVRHMRARTCTTAMPAYARLQGNAHSSRAHWSGAYAHISSASCISRASQRNACVCTAPPRMLALQRALQECTHDCAARTTCYTSATHTRALTRDTHERGCEACTSTLERYARITARHLRTRDQHA